jgi:hypothetical protein
VLAFGVRSPSDGAALVERLERSASRARWRLANAVALAAVSAAMVVQIRTIEGPSGFGGLAAAVLALTFAAAAVTKLARGAAWRRTLARYRLAAGASRVAAFGVPIAELVIVGLVVVGLGSTAGIVSLVALMLFSAAIVVGRVRSGRRLGCGCFGGSTTRDYRVLLARNLALAGISLGAWRMGEDAPLVRSLREPGGADLLPAALIVLGVALAAWVGATAFAGVGRRSGR